MRRDMVASILRRIDAVSRMVKVPAAAGSEPAERAPATPVPAEPVPVPAADAPAGEAPAAAEPESAPVPAP
jgi:hypothetical protein